MKVNQGGKRNIKSFWNADQNMDDVWKRYFNGLKPGDPKILEHPDFERLKQIKIMDKKG